MMPTHRATNEGTCTCTHTALLSLFTLTCVCFTAIKHSHYNYTFLLQKDKPLHIMYHLLMTIVYSTGVSEVAVLNFVAIEENPFPIDVGVTGTVGRQ